MIWFIIAFCISNHREINAYINETEQFKNNKVVGETMKIRKCKLLPLVNPNFEILNTQEELIAMLEQNSVIINSECPKSEVLGFVINNNGFYVKNGCIYGDCIFRYDEQYEWQNAEYEVDMKENNSGMVTSITGIYMRKI